MSNLPQSCSHADIDGFVGEARIRFNVIASFPINSSHSERRHSGSIPVNVAIKWFFHVRISRSALLVRCSATGVSSSVITKRSIQSFISCEHSLSIDLRRTCILVERQLAGLGLSAISLTQHG